MSPSKTPDLSDRHIEELARLFRALAEPSRLKIVRALLPCPQTVSELVKATGMKQGNISKHLGILLEARFLARTPSGNFARYSIIDPTLKALCRLMCGRVTADAQKRVRALR